MSAVAYAAPEETFTDRVAGLVEKADYRRAESEDEREAIFRLRYDAYMAEEAIRPNPGRRFTDAYDDLGNAWIFGVYLDGNLVSSIRLHVATLEFPDMPALTAFPDYLWPVLKAGKIIVDPTRFVIDRAASRRFPHLRYVTTRLAWIACAYFSADLLLASVRSEHQAFYGRVYGHRVVCEARPYLLLEKPLSLMTMDYFAGRDEVHRRYPFFRSSVFERRMLFERLQGPAKVADRLRSPLRVIGPAAPERKIG
jgi:hypothetical protein